MQKPSFTDMDPWPNPLEPSFTSCVTLVRQPRKSLTFPWEYGLQKASLCHRWWSFVAAVLSFQAYSAQTSRWMVRLSIAFTVMVLSFSSDAQMLRLEAGLTRHRYSTHGSGVHGYRKSKGKLGLLWTKRTTEAQHKKNYRMRLKRSYSKINSTIFFH